MGGGAGVSGRGQSRRGQSWGGVNTTMCYWLCQLQTCGPVAESVLLDLQ